MKLTYGEIKSLFPNHSLTQKDDEVVVGFSLDSRQIKKGEIFVALKGEKVDGHDFVKDVLDKGAAAALVERDVDLDHNVIRVPDVTKALGELALYYRKKFTQPVIAITGSSGKTTTKELLAHVLVAKGRVIATQGNLNNHWGVPLTIFQFYDEAAFFVVEMGMNHLGEIRYLAEITQPSAALITSVGRAHLEGLGGLDGVAQGKGELFAALTTNDIAFVFGDDPLIAKMPTKAQKVFYGFDKKNRIHAEKIVVKENETHFTICLGTEKYPARIPLVGKHQVQNALAVFTVAHHFGVPVQAILKQFSSFSLQMNRGRKKIWKQATLIDDTYNANPDSLRATLQALCDEYPQAYRIAVLGGMRELGCDAKALHFEVGKYCHDVGVQELLVLGENAEEYLKGFGYAKNEINERFFASHADIAVALQQRLEKHPRSVVLVKGSRGMTMERVFIALDISFS